MVERDVRKLGGKLRPWPSRVGLRAGELAHRLERDDWRAACDIIGESSRRRLERAREWRAHHKLDRVEPRCLLRESTPCHGRLLSRGRGRGDEVDTQIGRNDASAPRREREREGSAAAIARARAEGGGEGGGERRKDGERDFTHRRQKNLEQRAREGEKHK
eukprot:scaffold114245_cov35-Tisochrysis_lutea.AAC.2